MKSRYLIVLLLLLVTGPASAQAPQLSGERPALVLTIVVDQMRYDYLSRFGSEFSGGLKRLLNEGAIFTDANYDAAPSVTAVGHSTILSGATPSVSGIAANTWYERSEGKNVESITDDEVLPLGGKDSASPKRLAVSTVGDELKNSGKGGKVFGVSLKNRAAILPAGRRADGAFWLDGDSGGFMSSTWYFPSLPAWVETFNAGKPADQYAGQNWMGTQLATEPGPSLYGALDATPFADQLVLDFALTLMKAETLGRNGQTDLLSVSFSAMDYVGHATGPDSPRMHEMVLSVDNKVGKLLTAAEQQVGRGKLLVVFTADHGVAPVPEENMTKKLPGGRFNLRAERVAVEAALNAAFGPGTYVEGAADATLYLSAKPQAGPEQPDYLALERVAANVLRAQPHVARVYTRSELEQGVAGGDIIDHRVRNGFNPAHSGDLVVVHDPYWLNEGRGTTHGTPYSYDTHVPLIFWGPRNLVKPGQYYRYAAIQDVAPTLATQLGIAIPSGAIGRVLDEIIPQK